jgi:DNA-directed RNA polymerase specialized sigma24 family protein
MTKREKELIDRIKKGHPQARDDFRGEYISLVLRTIDTNDFRELVEDYSTIILDEVLAEAFKYIEKAERILNVEGLVYVIARRRISRYKNLALSRRKRMFLKPLHENIRDTNPNPEESIIDHEEEEEVQRYKQFLRDCMEGLTKTQRLVIHLSNQGYSWADIARKRQVTNEAIYFVKEAAYNRLRKCIDELQRIQ